MMGRCPGPVKRADLRAKSKAVSVLEAEADDHEIEITIGKPQQGAGRVGVALHMMLLLERLDDAVGRTVAILD